jgi:hemin uptake protein HemP
MKSENNSRPIQLEPRASAGQGHTSLRTSSEALLAGSKEIIIEHAGREYRLRVTAQGKLILTA